MEKINTSIYTEIEFFGRKRANSNPPLLYDCSIFLQTDFGNRIVAEGQWTQEGFRLIEGALVRKKNTLKSNLGILQTIRELLKRKFLVESSDCAYYKLMTDIYLSSPSTAARLVHGNDRDGLTDWKSNNGIPLATLKNAKRT